MVGPADPALPDPPETLTSDAAEEWQQLTREIGSRDRPLTLVDRATIEAWCASRSHWRFLHGLAEALEAQLAAAGPEKAAANVEAQHQLLKLLTGMDQAARTSLALARSMRLTRQSRMHPRTAGRAAEQARDLSLGGRKPWEVEA